MGVHQAEQAGNDHAVLPVACSEQQPAPPPPLRLIYALGFCIFMDWSIMLPSVVEYITLIVGPGGERAAQYFSYAQSAYSLCQFLVTLAAGRLMGRFTSFRALFTCACLLLAGGNVLYAMAHPAALGSVWALIAGRVVAGMGAGGTALSMTYLSLKVPPDQRMRALGNYRAASVLAATAGSGIAGVFTRFRFNALGFPFDATTMPGLFSALCFLVLAALCARHVHGEAKAEAAGVYMWNRQTALLMALLAVSCSSAATMLYVGPVIMATVFGWSSGTQSVVFLAAAGCSLLGTLGGRSGRAVALDTEARRFDAGSTLLALQAALASGIGLLYAGTAAPALQWACYLPGLLLVFAAYSAASTIVSSLFAFVLTPESKQAMMPLVSCVIAVGKVAAPVVNAGEYLLLGWDLVFGVWLLCVAALGLVGGQCRSLLRTQTEPLPEHNVFGNRAFKCVVVGVVLVSVGIACTYGQR